jgi:hypothetical protein
MPNWCYNKLTLEHKDPSMIARAVDAVKRGELLQEFIPCPEELTTVPANGETRESLLEKYGYSDWYDHNVNEWGVKWDVGDDDSIDCEYKPGDTSVQMVFDSAWGPPITAYGVFEALGFDVTAYYYEPGCAFCGIYTDGENNAPPY